MSLTPSIPSRNVSIGSTLFHIRTEKSRVVNNSVRRHADAERHVRSAAVCDDPSVTFCNAISPIDRSNLTHCSHSPFTLTHRARCHVGYPSAEAHRGEARFPVYAAPVLRRRDRTGRCGRSRRYRFHPSISDVVLTVPHPAATVRVSTTAGARHHVRRKGHHDRASRGGGRLRAGRRRL